MLTTITEHDIHLDITSQLKINNTSTAKADKV